MPNWVYNTINVLGTPDDIAEFASHIATPPRMISDEEREDFNGFSFHSFVTLPDEATLEEYQAPHGSGPSGSYGDTYYNWYNWNNANWNTKWDACNPALVKGGNQITISFETAWSQPANVFEAMVEQFPKLSFEIWWEEEQGFGEELQGVNGILHSTKSWDIPQSHADHADQDKLDSCLCNNYSEQENWYDDCPGKSDKQVFIVETITKRYIYAYTEEDAIEAAKAEEAGYGLPDHTEVKDTLYAEEFRVVDSDKVEEE
jgi:hypothetical protein